MCLIFKGVFDYVILSILSRGHDLESAKDRDLSLSAFFTGQYDLDSQHTFTLLFPPNCRPFHWLCSLLVFVSAALSFCPSTLLWDVPRHIIPPRFLLGSYPGPKRLLSLTLRRRRYGCWNHRSHTRLKSALCRLYGLFFHTLHSLRCRFNSERYLPWLVPLKDIKFI